MSEDDLEQPPRAYNTEDVAALPEEAPAPAPPRRRWRRWLWGILAAIVLVPVLIFSLWTWITLSYSYSKGNRQGYIQKFSKKGWVCKTWEGELAVVQLPGALPQIFEFTVRDDSVASEIQRLIETHEGRVTIEYNEHPQVPISCFGDTRYFVTGAKAVRGP
jgi:hypothetical protein